MFRVPLWPSELVTTTLAVPAEWGAAVAVIDVLLTTTTLVAAVPPIVTVAPARNPVPAMVRLPPPLMGPVLGVIEVTVGAGTGAVALSFVNFATEGTPLLFKRNSM